MFKSGAMHLGLIPEEMRFLGGISNARMMLNLMSFRTPLQKILSTLGAKTRF